MLLPVLLMLLASGEKDEAREGFSRIQTRTVPSDPYGMEANKKGR